MFSLASSSLFSVLDTIFAGGVSRLPTDEEIRLLAKKMKEVLRSGSDNESGLPRENVIDSVSQADCNVPSSSSDVIPKSLNSSKDYCPHDQTEAAGSSATKEDTRMSAVTREDVTETCPGLPRSCSSSQEEHTSESDGKEKLGNGSGMFKVSVEVGMQRKEKNLGINTVQDINSNNTEDQHDAYPILRDPQYEDISDYEDKSKPLSSELYEDVSDDEDQSIQMSAELSEPTTGNSRTGLDEVQIKNQIPETETRYFRSHLLQTEGDGHETNISCSVFKDKQELDNWDDDDDDDDDDEMDEEEDNIVFVLDLSISDLNFEKEDDGECGGQTSSSFRNARLGTAPNPVPASAFSQMEVFDTPAQQEEAAKCGQVSYVVPSSSSNHHRTSNIFRSGEELCSEAEDSCETDESSDYSSESESNCLTVSNQVVRNQSSSSLINSVRSDSERRSRGNLSKNFQKNSNKDAIVCIDSDDESDDECANETKSTKSSQNSENSGTCPANNAEPWKSRGTNVAVPPQGHTETANLCHGTAKGLCAKNKQTNSDDVIIILSDSDDDIIELDVEAMAPSLISGNSELWLKEHTVDKETLQGLKQSSAGSSEPRPESSWDKPGTSRLIPPGESSFHEPTRKMKGLTRKRMPSSETEVVNVDDDLNDAVNVCTKKKKAKLSEASGSLGPVIPRLLVQTSADSGEQIQLVHESAAHTDLCSSNPSTVGSHSDSFRNQSRYSIRDETGKFTSQLKCQKKVHSTPGSKVDQSSFEPKTPKRLATSLTGDPPASSHSSSCPAFPLKSSSSFSATTQSVDKTNHARRKVFSDWRKNHVPLRRERKARGPNYLRQSL